MFDKCMRLAPWSAATQGSEEETPLLQAPDSGSTQAGLLANLVSQDTYNIMSCVWICHYIWAIPLKVHNTDTIGLVTTMTYITNLEFKYL